MTKDNQSFETKLIHAGEPKPRIDGAINVPIFQSSTYEYAGEGSYHDVRYLRLSNKSSPPWKEQKQHWLHQAE